MIEVNINLEDTEKTYSIPTSWDEVTVKQFSQLYKVKNDNSNELLAAVNLINAITEIDTSTLLQMDIDDFKTLSKSISFISEEVKKTDVDYLILDGEKYYLYTDFNKLTTGEVITLETIIESSNHDIHRIIPDLLCLFLRKKNENGKYEKFTTDMLKRKELFLQVPISQIYHVFAFFLSGGNLLQNNTKDSTRNNDQSTTPKEDSPKN